MKISEQIFGQSRRFKKTLIPNDVHVEVTRNYGETASHKVSELLMHLGCDFSSNRFGNAGNGLERRISRVLLSSFNLCIDAFQLLYVGLYAEQNHAFRIGFCGGNCGRRQYYYC